MWGGCVPPPEENADLPDFTLDRAHLLLQEVYRDFPHHNDGLHLDGGVADDAIWQRRWRQLAAQSASWYATLSRAVGRRFTEILAAEWRGSSEGVGTQRDPLSSPTSSSRRRWASVGTEKSGHGSPGGRTSGRGVSMQA